MRKFYLILILCFILSGCFPSIKTEPKKNIDQRIYLHEFSFLPPNGNNWKLSGPRTGNQVVLQTFRWGRVKFKSLRFNKKILGKNQLSGEEEVWAVVYVTRSEFFIMKFDNDNELKEVANYFANASGPIENFNGMNCVRHNGKQGYTCVHPKHSNILIQMGVIQKVLKGQAPTNIQSELDHFFNSLEVH
jgi:hypothetical protein